MRASDVVIGLVRPDLLGTYGDGGNAIVLRQRLLRRGIPATVVEIGPGSGTRTVDIYVLGGGEDSAQVALADDKQLGAVLRDASTRGAPILGVCAGFQVLGEHFTDGARRTHAGFGLLDCRTTRGSGTRAVGEILGVATGATLGRLTGFENHAGLTERAASCLPLAHVERGVGNGDGTDGAVVGHTVGTYMHGPVLARNPALADQLLSWVAGPLPPLAMPAVDRLRSERISEALQAPGRRRGLRSLRRPRVEIVRDP